MNEIPSRSSPSLSKERQSTDREATFPVLIKRARSGDQAAMGRLMQDCRDYLLLIANHDLDRDLKAKIGASDVVQETLLTAHQYFEDFTGDNRDQLLAWLRAILKNDLRGAHRHYKGMQKRQVNREIQNDSDQTKGDPADRFRTPSTTAAIEEEKRLVHNAMQRLSAEHRQVLELRNWEKLAFSAIGDRMNRSEDAARKLWARAVIQLKAALNMRSVDP